MVVFLLFAALAGAVELSPVARVEAQRAIERARYAFVIGVTQPFDELYPRSMFEARVTKQMTEERMLQKTFGMVVTAALLDEEFARIEKTTRAPDQWEAIQKALGNDKHLIEEAFCRPPLVERALRAKFDFDQAIHAAPHQKARDARTAFLAKGSVAGSEVITLLRKTDAAPSTEEMLRKAQSEAKGPRILTTPAAPDRDAPRPVDPEVAVVLDRELKKPGDVTTILEQRERFQVFRLVEIKPESWKVEGVIVPKVGFDEWFEKAKQGLGTADRE